MEKSGLFRKMKVAANLIPPPPGMSPDELISLNKAAAKTAVIMYAEKHEDFEEMLWDAAIDHLMDTVLTDDLFTQDAGFIPTAEEQANMDKSKETAEMLNGLFRGLAGFLKHI